MFIELLVAGACASGSAGCSPSMDAYYKYNKDLQQISQNLENYGKKLTRGNEWLVYVASPAYAYATGQTANIYVFRGTTMGVNVRTSTFILQWTY